MAVSATVLIISLGLCGVNWGTMFTAAKFASTDAQNQLVAVLLVTSLLELAGLALGSVWLMVSLIGLAVESMRRRR